MSSGTERRIRELTLELEPVRPIPRLRNAAAWIAAAALAGLGVHAHFAGGPLGFADAAWGDLRFVAVFVGALLTAGGGVAVALGSSVPGRGGVAGAGLAVAGVGLSLGLGGALAGILTSDPVALGGSALGWACVGRAAALGLAPALLAFGFAWRAYALRPTRSGVAAAVGALSFGAAIVHVGCRSGEASHALLGHVLGPLLVAVGVGALASLALARRQALAPERA